MHWTSVMTLFTEDYDEAIRLNPKDAEAYYNQGNSYAISGQFKRAIEIGTNVNGKNLDEPEFWPIFERAQDLGLLISVHPTSIALKARVPRYHLVSLIGFPTDTAIAIASVIFGGVLEKLPGLKMLFSPAGGSLPYLIGRHDYGYKVRPECKAAIPKPPSEYFKHIFFDTITFSWETLLYLINSVGSDKVLLGSDYPGDMSDEDPVNTVAGLGIPEEGKQKIWGRNAIRLLNISM